MTDDKHPAVDPNPTRRTDLCDYCGHHLHGADKPCGWDDRFHPCKCNGRPPVEPLRAHPHDGYAYDGCVCVCCLNVRALASPAASRPEGLDVKRLARALLLSLGDEYRDDPSLASIDARDIAAEYARLSATSEENR